MKKQKAFTLIEILVAMLVGSFVVLLTTELISYQGQSRSQFDDEQQMLAFEIALKTLRGDINASMKSADGRKNVSVVSDDNSSNSTTLFAMPIVKQSAEDIFFASIAYSKARA